MNYSNLATANLATTSLMKDAKPKVLLSAIVFSLYFQGLDLFFYIASLIKFKPTWLTGIYQASLLITFCVVITFFKDSRKKLIRFSWIEALYISFFILVLTDKFLINNGYAIPENLIVYFVVYSFGFVLARALTFQQIKLVCYFTSYIAIFTCSLLLLQFLSGSASFANNETRLVTGLAANPINTGYIGAYGFLTSLALSIKANKFITKVFFASTSLICVPVCFLSGTRSANIFLMLGISLVLVANIYKIRKIIKGKKIFTNASFSLVTLFILIIQETFLNFIKKINLIFLNTFTKPWSRISQLLLINSQQVTDKSIISRYESYDSAINTFLNKPLLGGSLYSSGYVHNAFLQSASDFGILGILTFVLPFFYLCCKWLVSYIRIINYYKRHYENDLWMVSTFAGIILIEAICLFSFHGDPYRSYLPLCATGFLIAYSRLAELNVVNQNRSTHNDCRYY
jgi:hypothetical protein